MSERVISSRAAKGSSISRMGGLRAKARTRLTRCCIPPDSLAGNTSAKGARPTDWRRSSTSSSATGPRPLPRLRPGRRVRFSRTVRHGSRAGDWGTSPNRLA